MSSKQTFKPFFVLCLAIALIGCGSNETKKDSKTTADSTDTNSQTENKAGEAKLVCKSLGEDSLATPHAIVILSVNGQERQIDSTNSCEEIPRSDFARYEIPLNALNAVGGWWAGGGSYFYV